MGEELVFYDIQTKVINLIKLNYIGLHFGWIPPNFNKLSVTVHTFVFVYGVNLEEQDHIAGRKKIGKWRQF